jgi:hypothetical protein
MKMNLSISIINRVPKRRELTVMGQIQIGDFEEYFDAPLDWWSVEDYERQWKEALNRLVDHDRSCFVVAINDPKCRPFIEWWKLYKAGNKIYIRNSIVLENIYKDLIGNSLFTVETCYNFIPPRGDVYNEDGIKISEWVVDWDGKIIKQE